MKKKMIYLLSIFLLLLNACEKFIPTPDNELDVIDNREECLKTMNGAYAKLSDAYAYHNVVTIRSDDINIVNTSSSHNTCYREAVIQQNSTENFYRDMYKSILMCNRIIFDFTKYEQKEDLSEFLGEAYFLRAYLYFKLVRIFGNPPLITDLNVNYDLTLPSPVEVYDRIIADLSLAENLLPENRAEARRPGLTPHKGVAQVVLAEVYLTMGGHPLNDHSKYELAAQKAGEVIENASFYGFSLSEDIADIWSWDTHDAPESIWRIYFEPEIELQSHFVIVEEDYWTFRPLPEFTYFREFPENYRKDISFLTYYPMKRFYTIDSTKYESTVMVKSNPSNLCDFVRYCIGKKQFFNFQTNLIRSNMSFMHYTGMNSRLVYWDEVYNINDPVYSTYHHLFRYSQTLLTYAEASARSGQPDDMAYEALNMVRRRANKADLYSSSEFDIQSGSLTASAFADSVVNERAWELCHEFEGRWFDIVRLELLDEIQEKRVKSDPEVSGLENITIPGSYFLKLPQVDLWLNPNLSNGQDDE